MKQTGVWRQVAAAMSAPGSAAEHDAITALAASPTEAVVAVTEKLCASRRPDERRVGRLLAEALLAGASPERAQRLRSALGDI